MLSAPKILFVLHESARDSTFGTLFRGDIFLFVVTRTLRSFRARYRGIIFGGSQSSSVTTNDWYQDSRSKIRIFLQRPNRLATLSVFVRLGRHVGFPSASLRIATISQRRNRNRSTERYLSNDRLVNSSFYEVDRRGLCVGR